MSYTGKPIGECLLQGLSTSDVQDTWTDDRITYSSTNNKAELPDYYIGDWCLRSSIDKTSNTGTGKYFQNFIPYSGAHRSEHAYLENWRGTTNNTATEALICALNYIEWRLAYNGQNSSMDILWTKIVKMSQFWNWNFASISPWGMYLDITRG